MNDQKHIALSNLFSSLTSLANSQVKLTPQQVGIVDTSQAATSSNHLVSSVQTAMAAALIQQQLAATNTQQTNNQQQPNKLSNLQQPNYPQSSKQINSLGLLSQPEPTSHQHQQQHQQHQQRINYCTICNKELCNKYFMKTHMLKMHGINLGTEPAGSDEEGSGENGSEPDEEKSVDQNNQSSEQPSDYTSGSSQGEKKKSSSSKSGSSQRKKSSFGMHKQTTNVMNGYAGNSMGGVVCDICNKELCSKYFLKVHKQNTHGVTSDYQDTSQFMYPFSNAAAICPQNVFLNHTQPTQATFYPQPSTHTMFPGVLQTDADRGPINLEFSSIVNKVATKRQRLSQANNDCSIQQPDLLGDIEKDRGQIGSEAKVKQQFESVYRLLLAQQQQTPNVAAIKKPTAQVPTGIQFDRMQLASNAMNSIMCFNQTPNPFAMATMSPAMIVDNILRNQHMFKRNQPPSQIDASKSNLLDSNNNNEPKKRDSSTSSGGNNRYFSHYTEACPMCDRRFKSIKWLKTHMMNDHKQEIATYMQMMMQYSYANKSQQMAAAATMAALERQHHEMLAHHLKAGGISGPAMNVEHLQQLPPTGSLYESCFTGFHHSAPPKASINPRPVNSSEAIVNQPQVQFANLVVEDNITDFGEPLVEVDNIIDARCSIKSKSPNNSFLPTTSTYSTSTPPQFDRLHRQNNMAKVNQHIASGLNFELAPLPAKQVCLSRSSEEEEGEGEESEEELHERS